MDSVSATTLSPSPYKPSLPCAGNINDGSVENTHLVAELEGTMSVCLWSSWFVGELALQSDSTPTAHECKAQVVYSFSFNFESTHHEDWKANDQFRVD